MLARKFYAQRYTSNPPTNTAPAGAPSGQVRMNALRRDNHRRFGFFRLPNKSASTLITERKRKEIQCTPAPEASQATCPNSGICQTVKDMSTMEQGTYVENVYAKNCVLPEDKQKPVVSNVLCGEGS